MTDAKERAQKTLLLFFRKANYNSQAQLSDHGVQNLVDDLLTNLIEMVEDARRSSEINWD